MSRLGFEEETGTFSGPIRRHNGYWAGDFSTTTLTRAALQTWFEWGRSAGQELNRRPAAHKWGAD